MGRRLLAGVASAALVIAAGMAFGSGGLASARSASAGTEVLGASTSKPIRFEQHDPVWAHFAHDGARVRER